MHELATKYPHIYHNLIDDDTWAFIAHHESFYPPDAARQSIEQQREYYNRLCRGFRAPNPSGVSAENTVLGASVAGQQTNVACRAYTPAGNSSATTVILYLHGGGFVVGGLDSHDDICAELSAQTNLPLWSVDYRLSPEHPHPAALHDALAALRALQNDGRQVVVCGDSAGANLAAAATRQAGYDNRPVIGQVLIYPGLGADTTAGSFITHAEAPMLTTADVEFYKTVRLDAGQPDASPAESISEPETPRWQQPDYAPLCGSDFSGLPPTVAFAAGCDPLRDDADHYCSKLRSAGSPALFVEEHGLVHSYLRARHTVARAAASFQRIVESLKAVSDGSLPDLKVPSPPESPESP